MGQSSLILKSSPSPEFCLSQYSSFEIQQQNHSDKVRRQDAMMAFGSLVILHLLIPKLGLQLL